MVQNILKVEKGTFALITIIVLAFINMAVQTIATFFDISSEYYTYPLLWLNALAIFNAILPDRVGNAFHND